MSKPARNVRWSRLELETLELIYESAERFSDIEAALPGRDKRAILHKACELGLRRKAKWTEAHIHKLRTLYPLGGSAAVQREMPERSLDAIKRQARLLNVRRVCGPERKTFDGPCGTRECSKCKDPMPETAFASPRSAWCRNCQAIRQRVYRAQYALQRQQTWSHI